MPDSAAATGADPSPIHPRTRSDLRPWSAWQLLAAVGAVAAAIAVARNGGAAVEAALVERVLGIRGWSGVDAQGPMFVIWTGDGPPFGLKITWSCSALVQLAAAGGLIMALSTARAPRKAVGVALACAVVAVANTARIVATVWLAANRGEAESLVFHDWAGTAITLGAGAVAIAVGTMAANRRPSAASAAGPTPA
jgi:exosortase/archaeosortase family protein